MFVLLVPVVDKSWIQNLREYCLCLTKHQDIENFVSAMRQPIIKLC